MAITLFSHSLTKLPWGGGEIEIANTLVVRAGTELVLNLANDAVLKNNVKNANTDVIVVEEGATLTIKGEGTIEAVSGNDGYAVIAKGIVNIEGGTFKAGVDENGAANAVVYARGNGKVYVKGGVFPNEHNSAYVLNKRDADRATTTIEVTGGRFYKFNPENNAAEGAGTNFCKEGYRAVEDGENWYKVVEAPTSCEVYDTTDFTEALAAGATIINVQSNFGDNSAYYSIENQGELTINMNDYTLEGGTSGGYSINVLSKTETIINNGTITGGGFQVGYSGTKLIINDTNVNLTTTYNNGQRYCVYAAINAEVIVNGGRFTFDTTKKRSYFCATDNATIIVNDCVCGTAPTGSWKHPIYEQNGGQVIIRGGKFGFDPTNWVDEGYEAVKEGSVWVVRAKQLTNQNI